MHTIGFHTDPLITCVYTNTLNIFMFRCFETYNWPWNIQLTSEAFVNLILISRGKKANHTLKKWKCHIAAHKIGKPMMVWAFFFQSEALCVVMTSFHFLSSRAQPTFNKHVSQHRFYFEYTTANRKKSPRQNIFIYIVQNRIFSLTKL